MSIYQYEAAFGAWDKTSPAMKKAIEQWFDLYYQKEADSLRDPCQRIPYAVVDKLVKTVFGEYRAAAKHPLVLEILQSLNQHKKAAVQLALVGGECYIKPYPMEKGFGFTLIPRNNCLIFGRDEMGNPTDIGTVEKTIRGNHYYTLLERRSVDAEGYLTIRNQLYRSESAQSLGTAVPLQAHPMYEALEELYRYEEPLGSLGLVRMRTPMLNCVDGSPEGVSVYAAAVDLIRNIDRNEAQMNGEFNRGESRIIASADLLSKDPMGTRQLNDNLFVGLDEDPEHVGLTVFSPELREQSYLARKQEYLRNVESIIGLKRGMLSDANVEDRTATEIASSAGDYNLTVMGFQDMWEDAVGQVVSLCCRLAKLYHMEQIKEQTVTIDWGNGTLYDEDKTWNQYMAMVESGLLKPEIALGWRFNLPMDTQNDLQNIRRQYRPEHR